MKRGSKHTPHSSNISPLHEQLQQAIRDGGSTLAQILEAVPVGIFVINAAGKPFYANTLAQRLLGRGIAPDAGPEQLGETYHAYLAGTSTIYPADRMPIVRALSGETAEVTDMEIHHPDRVIPLQVWSAPIVDESGKVVYAIAAFSDISERKDAERRLSSQYEVARALAESPTIAEASQRILAAIGSIAGWDHSALWMVDLGREILRCVGIWQRPGHEASRFAAATRAMTYGPGAGLPGTVWQKGSYEWVVEGSDPTTYPRLDEARASGYQTAAAFPILFGQRVLGVIEFLSRDQRESDNQLVQMMEAHGSQIGQFMERELTELALRTAKEEAEREARSKADFLAIMSHEIRTPMNAVTGMTGLLLETELTGQQREFAEMAQLSAESLLSVINDILDFSRIESGNLVLESHPFELNEVIEEVFDLVAHQALQKKLDLVSAIANAVPPFIRADSTRLRQVLVNLVNNAIKFTEAGYVGVRVRKIDRLATGEELFEFTVEDTGIGISADQAAQLFRPFSQADTSTTRKHGGTGLGLAICKKLVDLMGGSIGVRSEPGKGAQFTFTIRAREASGSPKPYLQGSVPALEGKNALIVSGRSPSATSLEHDLQRWGIHTMVKASPESAAQHMAQQGNVDLVLIDGADDQQSALFVTGLRSSTKRPPPVVILSFLGSREHLAEIVSDPSIAVLSKPVKTSQLFDTILDALSGTGASRFRRTIRRLDPELAEKMPLRILVAEDNAMNQKLMLLVLEQMGYQADFVSTGAEALAKLEEQFYDVIFMDVEMPDMDGLEATRRINKAYPDIRRPVIIGTTAYGLAGDEHQCMEAGMQDCVNKPIRIEQIQECLLRWGAQQPPNEERPLKTVPAVIEAERIAELEDMETRAKRNIIGDLFRVYLEDLPELIKALHAAVASGDTVAAGKAAHRLKGTSLNVGANALADACRVVESRARVQQKETLAQALPEVERRAKEAESALRQILHERSQSASST